MLTRKLEVGLDCDGLLAHFAQHVIDKVNARRGTTHVFSEVKTWEIFESIAVGDKNLQDEIYDELRGQGGASGIPFFEDAPAGVARLRDIADVFIVTSPFRPSLTWMHEREEWVYKHFGIKARDVIHCAGEKKYRVTADVFVDDKVETVITWANRHPDRLALIWDAPYNQDAQGPRVKGWDDLYDRVAARAALGQDLVADMLGGSR